MEDMEEEPKDRSCVSEKLNQEKSGRLFVYGQVCEELKAGKAPGGIVEPKQPGLSTPPTVLYLPIMSTRTSGPGR